MELWIAAVGAPDNLIFISSKSSDFIKNVGNDYKKNLWKDSSTLGQK